MRVKICGINDTAGFDAAVAARADYVGFVFYPGSPRAVSAAQAAALSRREPTGPKRVGLFVAPTADAIEQVLSILALDVLQIYDLAELDGLRRFGLPIWRSIGIGERADLPQGGLGADELVLDAKPASSAVRPGGNAVSFDWRLLRDWRGAGPWWLAGGLSPHNVAEAIRTSGAAAVDVSSGVESAPGIKDPSSIAAFIANARSV